MPELSAERKEERRQDLVLRPSKTLQNASIVCLLVFTMMLAGAVLSLYVLADSGGELAALSFTAAMGGMFIAFSVAGLIAYQRGYVMLRDDCLRMKWAGKEKSTELAEVRQLRWRHHRNGSYVVVRGARHTIWIPLRPFHRTDALRLIHRLRTSVDQQHQVGWDTFREAVVIPMRYNAGSPDSLWEPCP